MITRIDPEEGTFQPTGLCEEIPIVIHPKPCVSADWNEAIAKDCKDKVVLADYDEYVLQLKLDARVKIAHTVLQSSKRDAELALCHARKDAELILRKMIYGDVFSTLRELQEKARDIVSCPEYDRHFLYQEICGKIAELRRTLKENLITYGNR